MRAIGVDLTGRSYNGGRVIVLRKAENTTRRWVCKCDCGKTFTELGHVLNRLGRKGCSQQCSQKIHGFSGDSSTRTYEAWKSMRQRCDNKNNAAFRHYGGRGIMYCVSWGSFETFLADMGECPTGLTLERINVNKGYYKGNCKWATTYEQNRNKRSNKKLTFGGRTQLLPDWSRELGVSKNTLESRLRSGWSVEKTLTTPINKNYSRSS